MSDHNLRVIRGVGAPRRPVPVHGPQRVTIPGETVQATDARCEQLAGVVEQELTADPQLPGNYTFTQISGGTGDYAHDDDGPVSALAYQVQFQYYLD